MLRCFEKEDDRPPPQAGAHAAVEGGEAVGAGRVLVCAACDHAITSDGARTSVDGRHEHTRTNPHGFVHRFGCFRVAPGCVPSGAPSRQSTWFRDHFWWVQHCGACGQHLGWLFYRADSSFYGLILSELRESEDDSKGGNI